MSIALSYPALNGETVTEAHAAYCQENGHAAHKSDGMVSVICPRCGDTRNPATISKAEVTALCAEFDQLFRAEEAIAERTNGRPMSPSEAIAATRRVLAEVERNHGVVSKTRIQSA